MRPSVKIHGGLGNQLFCYAFSLYVSKVLGIKVYVDVESGFKNDFFERTLSLEKIGFELYLPDQKVLDKNKYIASNRIKRNLERIFNLFPLYKKKYISERKHLCYDPKIILNLSYNTYFEGYWQSYLYTDPIREEMIDNVISLEKEKLVDIDLLTKLNSNATVSIHVRYPHAFAGNKISMSVLENFNVLKPDYYLRAIEKIKERIPNPKFVVFSDNLDYANKLIGDYDDIILMDQGYPDYLDLLLMSKCKHHIIANSTFSWWGAYLNTNPDKCVIAPYKWYKSNDLNKNDLMPKDWITL